MSKHLNTFWSPQRNLVMPSLIEVWSEEHLAMNCRKMKKKKINFLKTEKSVIRNQRYKRNEQRRERKKRHRGFRRFLCGFLTLNINRCSCSTYIWNSPNIIELILFSFFNYRKLFMVSFGHNERDPIQFERQWQPLTWGKMMQFHEKI